MNRLASVRAWRARNRVKVNAALLAVAALFGAGLLVAILIHPVFVAAAVIFAVGVLLSRFAPGGRS
jgi:4-hydroxybenzoate polyprenyltransferase